MLNSFADGDIEGFCNEDLATFSTAQLDIWNLLPIWCSQLLYYPEDSPCSIMGAESKLPADHAASSNENEVFKCESIG